MKYEAEIITNWTASEIPGMGIVNQPLASTLFSLDSYTDTTAQEGALIPPSPNLLVVQCVVEKAELDKIRAHPQHHCLWCRPIAGIEPTAELPDAEIPQTEEQALHTLLADRGTTLSDRTLAVGSRAAGRTRRDVARRLKAWLRTLKKAA